MFFAKPRWVDYPWSDEADYGFARWPQSNMNAAFFTHLKSGWRIDLSTGGNVLRVFDGTKATFVAVFGSKVDAFGMHDFEKLTDKEARAYSFDVLVSEAATSPSPLTFMLVTLQEGDEVSTEVLELLEIGPATYVVDAFVRGMEMMFFKLLRHEQGEFKILAFMMPKQRR